ncbi:MAG: rod-binding protein [Spirochaetia bacterium]|nr:rod-binding protein [Spirochaetia bacterium]MDD7612335.1 rod-binding protein [Spirochaetales bacterium]MDY5916653.1 rod-binding protein [Treponema sp.]
MNVGLVSNSFSSITNGNGALSSAKTNAENSKFMNLLKSMQEKSENEIEAGKGSLSSSQISANGRLNGDYTSGFAGVYNSEKDRQSNPVGAAANQSGVHGVSKKIDRTSELYEKSMELENYFVKQMLSEMRKTVMKSKDSDFAQQTYEDMLFDEYSTMMTKNAGFGLADQIYLSLV